MTLVICSVLTPVGDAGAGGLQAQAVGLDLVALNGGVERAACDRCGGQRCLEMGGARCVQDIAGSHGQGEAFGSAALIPQSNNDPFIHPIFSRLDGPQENIGIREGD